MSIIVVEIDTRKGSDRVVFDTPTEEQSEHAKQFWKTLILHPHMESRLYSKEISQVLRSNVLKETSIDNSRKGLKIDKKTEEFYDKIKVLNQVDEVKKIQTQLNRIGRIRSMQKRRHEKFARMDQIAKAALSQSETNLRALIAKEENEKLNDCQSEDYEFISDGEIDDKKIVKNLDKDDFFDDDDDDDDYDFDYSNNYDSYGKFVNESNQRNESH